VNRALPDSTGNAARGPCFRRGLRRMPGAAQGRAQVMDGVVLVRQQQPQGRAQAAQQYGDHQTATKPPRPQCPRPSVPAPSVPPPVSPPPVSQPGVLGPAARLRRGPNDTVSGCSSVPITACPLSQVNA